MAGSQPRYNYFDYGKSVQAGQNIQANRARNNILARRDEEEQRRAENLKKTRQIRQAFEAAPDQIEELEGQGLFDEADQLRQSWVKQQSASIDMLAGMREGIDESNYKEVRSKLVQMGAMEPELMPTEYSDKWFRKQIDDKKSTLKRLTRKWQEQGNVFAQDLLVRDGDVVHEGSPYDPRKASGSGGAGYDGMKSGDTNSIRNASAMLFGGMWDPSTGQFAGLDKEKSEKVGTLSAEAARIYDANKGRLPHDIAVQRAARKMGLNIPDLQNRSAEQPYDPSDPLNWRR